MAKCMVACFSDEYVESQNCALEFRFGHVSLKIPIIKAIVGTGNEWRKDPLAFLSGSYPEINFQYQNKDAFTQLLSIVQAQLGVIKEQERKMKKEQVDENSSEESAEKNSQAFQELYELTQRKFVGQITKIAATMQTVKQYPRLFCVDLIEKHKLEALQNIDEARRLKVLEMEAVLEKEKEIDLVINENAQSGDTKYLNKIVDGEKKGNFFYQKLRFTIKNFGICL